MKKKARFFRWSCPLTDATFREGCVNITWLSLKNLLSDKSNQSAAWSVRKVSKSKYIATNCLCKMFTCLVFCS